jgi:transcriptional regulator of acetoin/glycerol metabolism
MSLSDLPHEFRERVGATPGLGDDERAELLSALFATNWNKSRAAEKLRWSRMTLYRKMAKHQVTSRDAESPPIGAVTAPSGVTPE